MKAKREMIEFLRSVIFDGGGKISETGCLA